MIDFIKGTVRGADISRLYELFDFETTVINSTGEVKREIALFNTMKIIIYPSGRVVIQGSIHKYFNSINELYAPNQTSIKEREMGFNGNRFDLLSLTYALNHLCESLGVRLIDLIISNLEFGLNLETEFKVPEILSRLIRHRGEPFVNPKKYFYQAEHAQYFVKCYYKSWQYGMMYEVMRVELKYTRMAALNAIGIYTVQDLLKSDCLLQLGELLSNKWYEILLYDYTINTGAVSAKKQVWLTQYRDQDFWNSETKPNHHARHKKRLSEIVENHSKQVQKQVQKQIESEWINLQAESKSV